MKDSTKKHRKDFLSNLRGMKAEELATQERDLNEQLFGLQMKHQSGQLENTASLKLTKKAIARIRTLKREAELKTRATKGVTS